MSRETREGEENEGEKREEEESRSAMRSWNLVIHSELEVRFFDVYYYPLFSRFVRSCETTIHNAVVKKNLVFRFRLERYFRIVSYRITFSRVRCPPDKNQNKYENAIIKGERYRKRAREGKYRNRWNSLRC